MLCQPRGFFRNQGMNVWKVAYFRRRKKDSRLFLCSTLQRCRTHLLQAQPWISDVYSSMTNRKGFVPPKFARGFHEMEKVTRDIGHFESTLRNEFDRLLYAMDHATYEILTAFEGLHESLDNTHRTLQASCNSRSRSSGKLLEHPQWLRRQSGLTLSPSTSSMYVLKKATEMARQAIRTLTNLLFLEIEADREGKLQVTELLMMMKPYLGSPIFEKPSDIKYGLNHCVANILLKASNIPARTQNVIVGNSASADEYEELQLKRFYNKGRKALESFVGQTEEKWSERQKMQFINTCELVWNLQSIVAATMATHVLETLHPEPNSEFERYAMDTMDRVSDHSRHSLVQFTVFHGFIVDGSILIRPQVYLHV